MNFQKTYIIFLFAVLLSCEKTKVEELIPVTSSQIVNLHAPQTTDYMTNPPTITGDFVKFDFSSGETTTNTTEWDIAFRGTTILVNGGESTGATQEPERNGNAAAYILSETFSETKEVNESLLQQDGSSGHAITTGSGNGWYTYDPSTHLISPTAGKVLIFRTADNHYAKVEILSYYKDNDSSKIENGRYYTFNYVYQPNFGVTTFE